RHPRHREHHSRSAGAASERTRSLALRGTGRCVEQLPLLQGVHSGVPFKRESSAAQSRANVRATSTRRLAAARTDFQLGRLVRPNRLRDAVACKCVFEFPATAGASGENNGTLRETFATTLCERTIRPLVFETCCSRGRWPRHIANVCYPHGCREHRSRLQKAWPRYSVGRQICDLLRAAHC